MVGDKQWNSWACGALPLAADARPWPPTPLAGVETAVSWEVGERLRLGLPSPPLSPASNELMATGK